MVSFSPKNPIRINQNIAYSPTIKDNPMKCWSDYANALLDDHNPKFTDFEKGIFETLVKMLHETWDEVYDKKYLQRENAFAKWLYKNQEKLTYDVLKDDDTFKRFSAALKANFESYYVKAKADNSGTTATVPEVLDETKELIRIALDSIKNIRVSINKHVKECFEKIKEELDGTEKINSSLTEGEFAKNNAVLSSQMENDAIENEETLNTFEKEISDIQQIFKGDKSAPEYRQYIERIFKYKQQNFKGNEKLITKYSQIKSLTKLDDVITRYGKITGSISETYVKANLRTELFFSKIQDNLKKVGNRTLYPLLSAWYRKAGESPAVARKKARKLFEKFPEPLQLLMKMNVAKMFSFLLAPAAAYFVGINVIAFKGIKAVGKFTIGLFGGMFRRLDNMVSKLADGIFDFLANPLNAFLLGMFIPVIVRLGVNIWKRNKNSLRFMWEYVKILFDKAYFFIEGKIETWWENYKKRHPFIASLLKTGKDAITGTWVFRKFSGIINRITTFLLGEKTEQRDENGNIVKNRKGETIFTRQGGYLNEELKKDYQRQKKHIEIVSKGQRSLSVAEYIFNPTHMASKISKDIVSWFVNSDIFKWMFAIATVFDYLMVKPIKMIASVAFKLVEIVKPIVNNRMIMNFLEAIYDLFKTNAGQIAQLLGTTGMFNGFALLAIPAFIIGDMIWNSMEYADKKRKWFLLKNEYEEAYGGTLGSKREELTKAYQEKFTFFKDRDALSKINYNKSTFNDQFTEFIAKIENEMSSLDGMTTDLMKLEKAYVKEGKESIIGDQFLRDYGTFIDDIFYSPFFNTYVANGDIIGSEDTTKTIIDKVNNVLAGRKKILDEYFMQPIITGKVSPIDLLKMMDPNTIYELGRALNGNLTSKENLSKFDTTYSTAFSDSMKIIGKDLSRGTIGRLIAIREQTIKDFGNNSKILAVRDYSVFTDLYDRRTDKSLVSTSKESTDQEIKAEDFRQSLVSILKGLNMPKVEQSWGFTEQERKEVLSMIENPLVLPASELLQNIEEAGGVNNYLMELIGSRLGEGNTMPGTNGDVLKGNLATMRKQAILKALMNPDNLDKWNISDNIFTSQYKNDEKFVKDIAEKIKTISKLLNEKGIAKKK